MHEERKVIYDTQGIIKGKKKRKKEKEKRKGVSRYLSVKCMMK